MNQLCITDVFLSRLGGLLSDNYNLISLSKSATGQRVYHKGSDCKARGGNLGLGPRLNLEVNLDVNLEVNLEVD